MLGFEDLQRGGADDIYNSDFQDLYIDLRFFDSDNPQEDRLKLSS